MKKSKVFKLCSKHNLPEELWPEILSRLPVKSLLRFRCVSRSWKIWIDDPNFTRLHLNRYNNRSDSPILFVDSEGQCVVKKSETLRTISSPGFLQSDLESVHVLRSTPARDGVSVKRWNIVSSIDGLLLLQCKQRLDLMLWNPSIKKTLALPPIPEIPSLNYDNNAAGLGFDSLISDYKVVRFVLLRKERMQFATVYTLRSNSWKVINCPLAFRRWRSSIHLDGILYGIARDYKTRDMKLVSFDLRSEVFGSIKLPVTAQTLSTYNLTIVDDGCSLALVHRCEFKGSIWALERLGDDTETLSWIQRYTFDTVPPFFFSDFLCIKNNGEMLMSWYTKVICYNLETQQRKILMKGNRKSLQGNNTVTYMESLVMHS